MTVMHNDPANLYHGIPSSGAPLSGHLDEIFGYGAYRPEGTRDWLMILTLAGRGEFKLPDRTISCQRGDITLLLPGTIHHYYTPQDSRWELLWTHFVPEPQWLEWFRVPGIDEGFAHISVQQPQLMERLTVAFHRLIRDCVNLNAFKTRLAMNAMEEMLLLLTQSTENARAMDPRIADTLSYIAEHLALPHTVKSLASRVSLSPSRFAHLFKAYTGDSLMETLLKLRLRHASRLLEHTSMLVSEVARTVGFNSPFYFTKQFRALFGASPSAYRNDYTSKQ